MLISSTLSGGGSFCSACSAQRESVKVLILSRATGLFWQCPSAISMAFNSANIEPTLLMILACRTMGPGTQFLSFTQTADAPALVSCHQNHVPAN